MSLENVVSREEWEQLAHDITRIKASTQSMNRIMVMGQAQQIVRDILNAINGSVLRAAALHFASEPHTASELAELAGIRRGDLARTVAPLVDKSYIITFPRGREVIYKREEKVDLVNIERNEEFGELLKKWEER